MIELVNKNYKQKTIILLNIQSVNSAHNFFNYLQ